MDYGYGYDHIVNYPEEKHRPSIIKVIGLMIYYFAFIFVSFGVFLECQAEHHVWIVTNILNGIAGGVILVYPFNIFRGGDLCDWIGYIFLMFFLTTTASVIGGNLGYGSLT